MKKDRIFELDALRGIAILCMVAVHFFMDFALSSGNEPAPPVQFMLNWGGLFFILLSGVCATLGHHPIRRGLVVLAAGMVCTLATLLMPVLGLGETLIIRFGILHFLGIAMLLTPLLNKLPVPWLLPVAAVLILLGFWVDTLQTGYTFLFPLGLRYPGFSSGDYFPLLPNLGYYMAGLFIGKTVYKNKTTRLPRVKADCLPIRVLCFCGRQSLWIYLLHQPLIYGIMMLLDIM